MMPCLVEAAEAAVLELPELAAHLVLLVVLGVLVGIQLFRVLLKEIL